MELLSGTPPGCLMFCILSEVSAALRPPATLWQASSLLHPTRHHGYKNAADAQLSTCGIQPTWKTDETLPGNPELVASAESGALELTGSSTKRPNSTSSPEGWKRVAGG